MNRAFVAIAIIIALIVAILGLLPPQFAQTSTLYITHFFVGMLPVLGVAALLKYIACCGSKKCSKCGCADCKCSEGTCSK